MKAMPEKSCECAQCGKQFIVFNVAEYVYFLWSSGSKSHHGAKLMFCSYSCKEKYKKEHPQKQERRWMK